ncbi:MAG TPA: hypothetical protein EYP33_06630 [Pyrodictium sp.]|nr:hypothetical protein [Pyrodictium sp.]
MENVLKIMAAPRNMLAMLFSSNVPDAIAGDLATVITLLAAFTLGFVLARLLDREAQDRVISLALIVSWVVVAVLAIAAWGG